MSVQAITWALGVRVRSATHKAVLLVLANRMDPSGFGWPSQKLVAMEAECSDRTVRRVLAELEHDGVLLRSDRRRKDGSYSTDAIQFAMDIGDPADKMTAGQPADNLTVGQVDQRPNTTEPADNLSYLTTFEPNTKRTVRRKSASKPTANLPEAIESYNAAADRCGWTRLRAFTEERRQKARAAWKRLGGADGWAALLAAAEAQSFFGGANDRGWRMNFDFFINPSKTARILEGHYMTAGERKAVPDEKELRRRRAVFEHDGTWLAEWGARPDSAGAAS